MFSTFKNFFKSTFWYVVRYPVYFRQNSLNILMMNFVWLVIFKQIFKRQQSNPEGSIFRSLYFDIDIKLSNRSATRQKLDGDLLITLKQLLRLLKDSNCFIFRVFLSFYFWRPFQTALIKLWIVERSYCW